MIALHTIGRHFWEEINWSTKNLKTAQIGLTGFEQMTKNVQLLNTVKQLPLNFLQQLNIKAQTFSYRDGQYLLVFYLLYMFMT